MVGLAQARVRAVKRRVRVKYATNLLFCFLQGSDLRFRSGGESLSGRQIDDISQTECDETENIKEERRVTTS